MGLHRGGWWAYITHDEQAEEPRITRNLLLRVWAFARPYRLRVAALLLTILLISGVSLVSPLLYRDLIDNAIPNGDRTRLNWLALGMIAVAVSQAAPGLAVPLLGITLILAWLAFIWLARFRFHQRRAGES